jgi:hypothetical protein
MCSRIMGMMLSHLQKSGGAMIAPILGGQKRGVFKKKIRLEAIETGLSLE